MLYLVNIKDAIIMLSSIFFEEAIKVLSKNYIKDVNTMGLTYYFTLK